MKCTCYITNILANSSWEPALPLRSMCFLRCWAVLSASFRRSTCPCSMEIPEIEAALQEHRIDLGLVEGVFRLPNLKYTTFLEDELVAVVHSKSRLQLPEEITPRICSLFL